MDWLFITQLPKEGDAFDPDDVLNRQQHYLKSLIKDFLKTRTVARHTDYILLKDFIDFLSKEPSPNENISFDVPKISPTRNAD